jgi:SAM-dependent methyltransferase
MPLRPIVAGLATYVPGLYPALRKRGSGHGLSAAYCYGVWLKHLSIAWQHGLKSVPHTVAEFGPGDSLGVGLAALLSGVSCVYALDVVEYSNTEHNLRVFEELVKLFSERAAVQDRTGWPTLEPYLGASWFPDHILTESRLRDSLAPDRLNAITNALMDAGGTDRLRIRYIVPWFTNKQVPPESVDMIFSHAVLEHVDDIAAIYSAMNKLLRPGGIVSHQIDFSSHGTANEWNGHWAYSDPIWSLIRGKRQLLINRLPYSAHVKMLETCGFRIVCALQYSDLTGLGRNQVAPRWRDLPENDLSCKGAFLQATKVTAR